MPEFSELHYEHLNCPRCGAEYSRANKTVCFQWGAVPTLYEMGDTVEWLDERSSGFERFADRMLRGRRWNCGDRSETDVYVLDTGVHFTNWKCESCGTDYDGVAVKIIKGVIVDVVFFEAGQLREEFDISPETTAVWGIESDYRLGID